LEADSAATMMAFDSVKALDFVKILDLSLWEREALVETMPGGQAFDSPAINVMKIARKSVSAAAPTTLCVLRWVFNRTIFDRPNMALRLIVVSDNTIAEGATADFDANQLQTRNAAPRSVSCPTMMWVSLNDRRTSGGQGTDFA